MRNLRLGRPASKIFGVSEARNETTRFGHPVLGIVLALIALGIPQASLARSGGAPLFSSGGSFPGEQLCTRCHVGTANSGSGSIELLVNDTQSSGFMYAPGVTVPILVRASDAAAARIGFQFTARLGNGCTQGGTIIAGSSMRVSSAQGQGDCSGTAGELQWVTHTRPRNGSSAEFRFDWTAPEANSGPVTFAVAVLAANGNGSTSGDQAYSLSATLEEQTSVPLGPPQISQEQGVVLGDFHTMTGRGVAGALATVRGTDFVDPASEQWLGFDPADGYPTDLGGTCVKANGIKVPLKSVSFDRIDFQVPVNATVGRVSLQVVRNCDEPEAVGSNESMFEIVAAQPAFLWHSADPPAIAARHSNGMPIGPKGLLPGIDTSPATPGEVVSLYGTGFGPVTPALATGEAAREQRSLASTNYEVSINGTAVPLADVPYIGAAPGFLGVYRVDVRLSADIAAGLHTISLKVNDVASPPGTALIVASPPAEPQSHVCALGQALLPGQTCRVEALGARIFFAVAADSSSLCASVPLRNQKTCGTTELSLPQYGYSAAKDVDGGWAVSKDD